VVGSPSFAGFLPELVPEVWATILGAEALDLLGPIGEKLDRRAGSETILPKPHQVFRALTLAPEDVSVIIIGQDPYPSPGHATGLAFSVPEGVRPLPPTLKNILRELSDDLGIDLPRHGNLTNWHNQGVLLINRHLTTAAGQPGAHHRLGWSAFTNKIVEALVRHNTERVAVLWGREARTVSPLLEPIPTITSSHPSPLSAHSGFFGSRPFSLANRYLTSMGRRPIDWNLDQATNARPG
jgi:uracil-DNA glycosylase